MSDALSTPVLVLNRQFQPVQITRARRAFVLLFGGSAHAVDRDGETYDFDLWRLTPPSNDDDTIPIVGGSLRIPRVLHLQRYDRLPKNHVRLTRRNLLLRDENRCQYCARTPPLRDLNIDHVMPRSRGGPDTWENLVVACRRCNLVKGRRTPDEARMRLLRVPKQPYWPLSLQIAMRVGQLYKEWEPFLQAG